MSAASHTPGNLAGSSGPPRMQPKTGRNTVIAMALLVSGFSGFYYSMKQRDDQRKKKGNLQQYELAVATRPADIHLDQITSPIDGSHLPKAPVQTHNAQHAARTPGWSTNTESAVPHHHHIHQPAPQREKGDGSGQVYTKKNMKDYMYNIRI
ncbi:hypothetical protein BDP27DRAFT_1444863 [Rhodocollybia butyracea]|uniref:Uncharacterized protein n=1 Tax=Rhodocollybia butyracea TaxID=206335 RepID=A0A9P5Q1V3_9AGAR|nr:hypothetical protein BDP27DRAFT_1444863 [Rhodocollybia butyracea]